MTMHSDDVLREVETLLIAMSEGTLDASGRRRLSQLVAQDREARDLYLDHCQMHSLLRSSHGVLTALKPPSGYRGRRAVWWAVGGALLALAASIAFMLRITVTKDDPPTIASTRGDVRIVRNGQDFSASTAGQVQNGERVVTGPDGTADLNLAEGVTVRVDTLSDVGFTQQKASRQVHLKAGALRGELTKQPSGRPLVFQTPHAELLGRGAAFELTVTPVASRVQVFRGRLQWTAGGQSIEVVSGEVSSADTQGLQAWQQVCEFDFRTLKALPPELETVYCDAQTLHTAKRKTMLAPKGIRLTDEGLRFVDARPEFGDHGLIVSRWTEEVGSDLAMEVEVSAGEKWSLGFAVDGDSFEGYRIIFAAPHYPNGITIDSFYPSGVTLLAQDPRPIQYERDHTLRVEKLGRRIRVWVDREIRIDTELNHTLASGRKQTFAISNFGDSPVIRSLKVWKAAPTAERLE